MNILKGAVAQIYSVSGIMWLQFVHYHCLIWFHFQKLCGSSHWSWNPAF